MTTLRVLALSTTFLVAAAATCLATFAQIPAPTASPALPLPACAANALALHVRDIDRSGADPVLVLAVIDSGEACEIGRIPNVSAFDAAGRERALAQPKHIGFMRFLAKPIRFDRGTGATFTIAMSQSGSPCARVAKLAIAARAGIVATPVDQTACTRPDGSNVTISLMSPDTGR